MESGTLSLTKRTISKMHQANGGAVTSRRSSSTGSGSSNRKEFSSLVLFLSVIIFFNLCPFQEDFKQADERKAARLEGKYVNYRDYVSNNYDLGYLDGALQFMKTALSDPMQFGSRSGSTTRYMQADAKIIAKMAKMWYIKKKIKKFNKKLKKHTIAVPVITAIPIYEHSYYPSPHVTHVSHPGVHHAAAASYYAPAYAPAVASSSSSQDGSNSGQLATSASNTHQQRLIGYRMPHHLANHQAPSSMYSHPHQHQIINSYAPSPAMYMDSDIYGAYGNHPAYGTRYDGGYHYWRR